MTNANAANVLEEVLPYDLDAIREVFAKNNQARRDARQAEVEELNRAMAKSAQRQHEIDQANEKLLASVLRRLAFTESLLKQERDVRARLQATIDTFTGAIARAAEPLQLGVEDTVARVHTIGEVERNFREQYEPPKQPEPPGGGDDDGGQREPVQEPPQDEDEIANDLQRVIDEERHANEPPASKPAPVMPLAPAARVTVIDDPLEIPEFLRRRRPDPSETTVEEEPPAISGHAEELFHRTAEVAKTAIAHVSEAARGQFGKQRAA